MRKSATSLVLSVLAFGLAASAALAQSSGNFTADIKTSACVVDPASGALSGGLPTGSGGTFTTTIKLPGGSPALLITPSLATGLFTATTAMGNNVPVTANGAIVVSVADTYNGVTTTLVPDSACVDTSSAGAGCSSSSATCVCGVIYDQRFQQLQFNDENTSDTIKLVQSTLTAHSFNFVEPTTAQQGQHTVTARWAFGCPNATGSLATASCTASEAACAGPGSLTVQQVQNFEQDSTITTTK